MRKGRSARGSGTIGGAVIVGALLAGGVGAAVPRRAASEGSKPGRHFVVSRTTSHDILLSPDRRNELVPSKREIIVCSDGSSIDTAALDKRLRAALERARNEIGGNEEIGQVYRTAAVDALDYELARLAGDSIAAARRFHSASKRTTDVVDAGGRV